MQSCRICSVSRFDKAGFMPRQLTVDCLVGGLVGLEPKIRCVMFFSQITEACYVFRSLHFLISFWNWKFFNIYFQ